MDKQKKAQTFFTNQFNCSQSVLVAFGNEFGFTDSQCLKVACAFGAGIARNQYTCGAVTGAIMALGLKYGKAETDPEEKKQSTYAKSQEFIDAFTEKYKSINCKDLLNGLNIKDEKEYAKILELDLFKEKCYKYVTDAVTIASKIMEEK